MKRQLHGGEKCPALVSLAGAAVLDANAPVFGLGVSQLNWRILAVAQAA